MRSLIKLFNLGVLSAKQVARNRTRSTLTLLGVATGLFLFTVIETMQQSLRTATVSSAQDNTLIVYRENRFCPATSRLPEHYQEEILRVDGVKDVLPVQIVVNNCGTSLDVVVFRGIPVEAIARSADRIEVLEGSLAEWMQRDDGALIGKTLAQRRKLGVGDRFDAAGISVFVSGIIEAEERSQNNNLAMVHLPFLQQSSKIGLGVVTQFNVKVENPEQLDLVAKEIDLRFKSDSEPTSTKPEKAFFASTAKELVELIGFSRWIGWASVLAVTGLVSNSILLSVRGKVTEYALFKTLGFSKVMIAWMTIAEGLILATIGGIGGILGASLFLHLQSVSIGNEGLILTFLPSTWVVSTGIVASVCLGLLAGLYPAWLAGRGSISQTLKSV